MRIGIITFQKANNYGALLQTYALQTVLKKQGNVVDIIDYTSRYIEKPYALKHLKNKGLKNYLIGFMGYFCYLPRKKRCNRFRKYISYTRNVNADTISDLNQEYDIFITGSDQVWNYKLTGGDMNYLLKFVDDNRKKFSYAASIGLTEIESNMIGAYKEKLLQFRMISLREKKAEEIVEEITGIRGQVVLDPTLLLSRTEWERVMDLPKSKEKYIAVYQLGISAEFVKYVRRLAKEKKLKVKYIPFPLGSYIKARWMLHIGPSEWLGIIRNAEYVVTDSYHGMIFSLFFHKKFAVEVIELNKNVGSRIYDLLEKVGMEERLLNNKNLDIDKIIDYDKVDNILKTERNESMDFIQSILESSI